MSTTLHGLRFGHVSSPPRKKNPDLSTIHVAGLCMPMAMRMHAYRLHNYSGDHLGVATRCNLANDYKLLTLVLTAISFKE